MLPPGQIPRADFPRFGLPQYAELETASGGSWEVRTLGEKGSTKLFDARRSAMKYAAKLKPGADVVVDQLEPKKITVVRSDKTVKLR